MKYGQGMRRGQWGARGVIHCSNVALTRQARAPARAEPSPHGCPSIVPVAERIAGRCRAAQEHAAPPVGDPIAQLDDEALAGLLSDPGEAGEVLGLDPDREFFGAPSAVRAPTPLTLIKARNRRRSVSVRKPNSNWMSSRIARWV